MTIVDDDQALTGWSDTRSTATSTASQGDAASLPLAYSTVGTRQYTEGDRWMIILSDRALNRRATAWWVRIGLDSGPAAAYPPDVRQRDGSNQRHLCGVLASRRNRVHVLHAYLAVGGVDVQRLGGFQRRWGLLKTYYDSAFLEPSAMAFSRVDQVRRQQEQTISRVNERRNERSMLLFSCVHACTVCFLL